MSPIAPSPSVATAEAPICAPRPETWSLLEAAVPEPPPQGPSPSAWPDETYRGWSGL